MFVRWSEKRPWSSVQLRDPSRQSVNQQGVEMLEIHRQMRTCRVLGCASLSRQT